MDNSGPLRTILDCFGIAKVTRRQTWFVCNFSIDFHTILLFLCNHAKDFSAIIQKISVQLFKGYHYNCLSLQFSGDRAFVCVEPFSTRSKLFCAILVSTRAGSFVCGRWIYLWATNPVAPLLSREATKSFFPFQLHHAPWSNMLQWMQFNVKFSIFWWLCNIENDLTPAVACNKIQHFLKKQDEEMDRKTDISKMQCSCRKCITLFGFKSAFHLLVFPCLHLLWYA